MLTVWLAFFHGVASQNEKESKVSTKSTSLLSDCGCKFFSSYNDSKSLSPPLQFTLGGTDRHHSPGAVYVWPWLMEPQVSDSNQTLELICSHYCHNNGNICWHSNFSNIKCPWMWGFIHCILHMLKFWYMCFHENPMDNWFWFYRILWNQVLCVRFSFVPFTPQDLKTLFYFFFFLAFGDLFFLGTVLTNQSNIMQSAPVNKNVHFFFTEIDYFG